MGGIPRPLLALDTLAHTHTHTHTCTHTCTHTHLRIHTHTHTHSYTTAIESFRSAFTLNVDIINHYVTLFTGNVHGEILTFYMPGTMFHHKHIPMGSFLVRRFVFRMGTFLLSTHPSLVSLTLSSIPLTLRIMLPFISKPAGSP